MEFMNVKIRQSTLAVGIVIAIACSLSGCNDSNTTSSSTQDPEAYKKAAEDAVVKMTVDEKLNIVMAPGIDFAKTNTLGVVSANPVTNLKSDTLGTVGYINGVLNDKLNIPAVKLADGPAGLRINYSRPGDSGSYYATAWPIGSLLASSWDAALVEKVGRAIGEELKEYGIDIILAPGMNIQRDPLNGRNFEYYSEDPLLSGKIGAAMVKGIQANNVGATIKHFVANNSETNSHFVNAIVTPRALREIYLRGFEIAVEEAQPWVIMSSFNKVNGIYTNERSDLLTDILRNEWGFKGFVTSDWFAGTPETTAYKQLLAGNDLIEPGGNLEALKSSFTNGDITEQQLNTNVVRILTQVFKTPSYKNYAFSNQPDLNSHATLARRAAAESMVLLKNQNAVLPLAKNQLLASFGITQINTIKGGTGSGEVNNQKTVTIAEGLSSQFTTNIALETLYGDYFTNNKVFHPGYYGIGSFTSCEEPDIDVSVIETAVQSSDVAVITLGRIAGEGADRTNSRGDYLLTETELKLIENVSAIFHEQGKSVVVVLNVSGVMDTAEWADKVDAILLAYLPGQEAGNAIADVLSGAVNPAGKLTQTIPVNYADVPSSSTFTGVDTDGDGKPDDVYYNDDIYVGYRYYQSFDKPVAYSFGYGLSYTTFSYTDASMMSSTIKKGEGGNISLSVTVTNTGNISGREVVQVYINAPEAKLKKPTIELKAFAKTAELRPGSSEKVVFNIPTKTLASYDESNNQWIIESGEYRVYISPSSDIANIEPITFSVPEEVTVSQTTPEAMALPHGVSAADFVTIIR